MHSIPAVAWKWTLQTAHLANLASQILRSLKGIWMSDVMYLLLPPLSPSGASVVTPQTIRWLTPLVRRISLRPVMKKAPLPPKFKIEWQISQISEKSRARVFCSNGKCWDRLSSLASLSQSHHPWLNAWVTECEESKNANCYSACLAWSCFHAAIGLAPWTKSLPGDPSTRSRPMPSTMTWWGRTNEDFECLACL